MSGKNRLAANADFLRLLHNSNSKQRKQLIKSANKDQILSVCECAFNILRKNVRLSPTQIRRLRKYKPVFYKLVDKKIPLTSKRRSLEQSGGFLPALLAPLAMELLSPIVSPLVDRYIKPGVKKLVSNW